MATVSVKKICTCTFTYYLICDGGVDCHEHNQKQQCNLNVHFDLMEKKKKTC